MKKYIYKKKKKVHGFKIQLELKCIILLNVTSLIKSFFDISRKIRIV